MTYYNDELRREIVLTGIALAHAWIDRGKGVVHVTNIAKQIAHKHGHKWGAISDRLRNVMYFETGGHYGRKAKYSPAWVESEYHRIQKDEEDLVYAYRYNPMARLRLNYKL